MFLMPDRKEEEEEDTSPPSTLTFSLTFPSCHFTSSHLYCSSVSLFPHHDKVLIEIR